MTRVDFYVVPDAGSEAALTVAIRLVEKARRKGHRLFIHSSDEQQAKRLDELMWQWPPTSFIPHSLAGGNNDDPVVIGWGQAPEAHDDVLINLAVSPPSFFSRVHRVAEIVTQDPQHLEAQRQAWRFYKDRGYPLAKHDL